MLNPFNKNLLLLVAIMLATTRPQLRARQLSEEPAVEPEPDQIVILVDNGETMKLPCGTRTRHEVAVACIDKLMAACPDGAAVTIAALQNSSQMVTQVESLDASGRDYLVETFTGCVPAGKASFDACLQSNDLPWKRFHVRPTTFILIGDGAQCGLDNPEVVRLTKERLGPQKVLLVLGTCQNSESQATLSKFATSCGGLYSPCDSTAALQLQVANLIALITGRQNHSDSSLIQLIVSLQQQHSELHTRLVEKLELQNSEFKALSAVMHQERSTVRQDILNLNQKLEAIRERHDSLRELLVRMESTLTKSSELVELRQMVNTIAVAQKTSFEKIRESVRQLATKEEISVVSREIKDLRDGRSSDDTRSLVAINRQLALLNKPDSGAARDLTERFNPWLILLMAAVGCGLALLLGRITGILVTKGEIEQLCATNPAHTTQVGCVYGTSAMECRFVPGKGPAPPPPAPPPPPGETGRPLDIEAVSVAADLSRRKSRSHRVMTGERKNSPDDQSQQLTMLVGGDHRIVTELFGLGVDSIDSLGNLTESEIRQLAPKLTDVREQKLKQWVDAARRL